MRIKLKRALAMTTALAAAVSVSAITSSSVSALPPGTPATPGQTLTVASGNQSTTFALTLTAPNNGCPGNASVDGYRWHQYLVSAAVDAGTLTWNASGPVLPAGAPVGSITQPLFNTTGSPQVQRTTIGTAAPFTISGTSTLNLNTNLAAGVTNGAYKIGFACSLAGQTEKYWETPITISNVVPGVSLNYSFGAVPSAPTGLILDGTSPSGGVLAGSFSAVTATPAVTGYTVTLSPGGATVTVPAAGPYTFSFPGLTNGTAYTASVVATNSVGDSAAATATATVNVDGIPAPVVSAPSSASPVLITITPAPVPGGATLVSHTVTIPGIAGSPFTLPAGTNTLSVTGGTAGTSYPFTVQANYNAPFIGDTFSGTFSVLSAQVIVQDLTVVRPQGALVLTQRCGVYGSAAAYTDTTFGTLPALTATTDADTVGALPGGTAPTLGLGGAADPLFAQYPYPVDAAGIPNPNYPTDCAIDLGIGQLITSGPRAGQYFKATGRIAQVTVINTRDADSGWTLNGRMSDFTSTTDATDTFSGNLLGWNPEVTWDSSANLDGYDMTVTQGGVRQPEASASTTGLGAGFNSTNTALASSLAQATPGASLGQAVMDARLRLLIPVTADAGTYTGVLTFTTV